MMDDQRLHLHGQEYMKRLLKQESRGRLPYLIDFVELDKEFVLADFGCGNAPVMELVSKEVRKYCGVDFSPAAIEFAKKRKNDIGAENAELYCGSIKSFCEKNSGRFDAGLAMDISEHVYDEEWLEILSSIRRSLKPEGKLYIHTPNGEFFLEIMKSHNFVVKQFPEHVAVRNARENLRLLVKAGFNSSKVLFLPHYNILKFIHVFSGLPWVGRFFKARLFIIARKS